MHEKGLGHYNFLPSSQLPYWPSWEYNEPQKEEIARVLRIFLTKFSNSQSKTLSLKQSSCTRIDELDSKITLVQPAETALSKATSKAAASPAVGETILEFCSMHLMLFYHQSVLSQSLGHMESTFNVHLVLYVIPIFHVFMFFFQRHRTLQQ